MPYIGRSQKFGVRTVFHFLATNGQTSVSGSDADSKTLSFADGNYIDVYLNGVRLKSGEDYNTSTANTVAGLSALNANDEVNILVYDAFSVADTVQASTGGTFGGAISVTGDVTSTGTVNVTGDTAAGDDASIGFTSAEGLILTGQGTTSDVTIKNDADATVMSIATGTTGVNFAGDVTFADGADIITASAGTSNFRAGVNAGNSIASGGNYNVTVGDEAGTALTTGDNNVAIGFEALATEDADGSNVAVGYRALKVQNTGAEGFNVAVGKDAGTSVTTGVKNTLIGGLVGDATTEGAENVAMGYNSMSLNTLGSKTVAIGAGTLRDQNYDTATDSNNTVVGYAAGLLVTTGIKNTFLGARAGDATDDGASNVAVGYLALSANCGDDNTAVGESALEACTGSNNTAVGRRAGEAVSSGSKNTFVGTLAGDANDTGNNNTFIGAECGDDHINGENNVGVGYNILMSATGVSNEINIGTSFQGTGANTFNFGKASNVVSNNFATNASFSRSSDERLKTNISTDTLGLDFVNNLRTVKYKWKASQDLDSKDTQLSKLYDAEKNNMDTDTVMHGLIAQEVKTALDTAGVSTFGGWSENPEGIQQISREMFVIPLIKAIQELSTKNDALEARIKTLEDK